MKSVAIAWLAKSPVPGQVKTRMCPPCTPEEAAELAKAFLADAAEMLDCPEVIERSDVWCSYDGPIDHLRAYFPAERMLQQRGTGLGARIVHVVEDLIAMGYRSVMVIAGDCPTANAGFIVDALDQLLRGVDVVLGPTVDGGCSLVGVQAGRSEVFQVEMSTDHVLADMLALAEKQGWSTVEIAVRHDIDTIEDLRSAATQGQLGHAVHTRAWLHQFEESAAVRSHV